MVEELSKDEIRKRILACLEQKSIDRFHPARIGVITFGVYQEIYARSTNQHPYNMEVFEALREMEKEPEQLVKNLSPIPSKDKVEVMKASSWLPKSKL
jgi:hypothetical protein